MKCVINCSTSNFIEGLNCTNTCNKNRIGERYSDRVTAGQSFGQKNTMFLIWVAYTFMNPVTSLAGGLYSIWHNLYNSWQLYKERGK